MKNYTHHDMAVDRENIVRIARDRYESEAITPVADDVDDGKVDIGTSSISPFAVDESCVGSWDRAE